MFILYKKFHFSIKYYVKSKILIASILFLILIFSAGALIIIYDKFMYPMDYREEILFAAQEFQVDSALIASVINAESHFNFDAISKKGAVGLMQVKPSTAEWVIKKMVKENIEEQKVSSNEIDIKKIMYNEETKTGELLDPLTNIRIGTYYLKYLLDKFGDLRLALCAYNAGEGTIRNWLGNDKYSKDGINLDIIPYKETHNYLIKVNRNLKVYEKKI